MEEPEFSFFEDFEEATLILSLLILFIVLNYLTAKLDILFYNNKLFINFIPKFVSHRYPSRRTLINPLIQVS